MNLFRFNKLKAPLIAGAMLIGAVACSDYDEDIAGLSDRLDEIEGSFVTISSMEDQITAVENSIPDLTSIYNDLLVLEDDLSAVESELDTVDLAELSESVSTLESTIKGLESLIEDEIDETVTTAFLQKLLDNVYMTEVALADIENLVTAEYVQGFLGDSSEGFVADIVDAIAETSKWVGSDTLADYLLITNYTEYTDDKAKAAAQEYFETITATLVRETEGTEYGLVEAIELTDTTVAELSATVATFESRIAELEGRIQSLVFVPETALEHFDVTFTSKDYLTIDSKKVYLEPKAANQKLTFRVSPAEWAAKIEADDVTLCSTVEYTRAASTFEIVDVELVSATEGTFTIELKCNIEDATEINEKGYGIAFNIKTKYDAAKADDETSTTDYTTSYLNAEIEEGRDITNYIVYGSSSENYVSAGYAEEKTAMTTIQYTDTATHTFFAGCDWYVYAAGASIYSYELDDRQLFSNLYTDYSDTLLSITPPEDTDDMTVNPGDSKNYSLTATTAAIKTSSIDLVDNVITSGYYTFALYDSVNKKTKTLSSTTTYSIKVGNYAYSYKTTDATVQWTYATSSSSYISSSGDYNFAIEVLDCPYTIYNDLVNGDSYGSSYIEITNADNTKSYYYTYLRLLDAVSYDGDKMSAQIFVRSNMPSGTYTGTYEFTLRDDSNKDNTVSIETTFTVDGVPTIPDYIVTKPFDYTGQASDVIDASIFATIWDENEAALTGHFADVNEFAGMMGGITPTAETKAPMTLGIAPDNTAKTESAKYGLQVEYNDFSKYTFGTTNSPTLTYNSGIFVDNEFKITAKTALNNPYTNSIAGVAGYVNSAGNVEIEMISNGTELAVVSTKDLENTFKLGTYDGKDLTWVYAVNMTTAELKAWNAIKGNESLAQPAVDISNKLSWNGWDATELPMKVTAYVDGVAVDSKTFTAYISSPLESAMTASTLELYYEERAKDIELDLQSALSLKLITALEGCSIASTTPTGYTFDGKAGDNIFAALSYSTTSGDVTTTYKADSYYSDLIGDLKFEIDDEKGVIELNTTSDKVSIKENAAEVIDTVTYNVKATFTINYFEVITVDIPVKVYAKGVTRE